MDNSLLINKYILSFLEDSELVTEILGEDEHKIFPLIQPESLTFPYIVFQRSSVIPEYTKDLYLGAGVGWTNTVNINVKCISDQYDEGLLLANAVRNTLEGKSYSDEDIKIDIIQLASAIEYTTDTDTFVQELTFEISVE